MSKIIIDDLLDETSFLNDANERFQQIADEFNEKVLYRANPTGEPNGMFNDLDMQENDVLNVGQLDVDTLILAGIPFNGAVNWGHIGGNLSDQTDLWEELQRIENSNVNTLTIGSDTLLDKGLKATRDSEGNIVLEYTDRVNKEAFGMVRLNSQGKVPLSLLDLKPVEVLGFFYGDDECPKPIDTAGIPGVPVVSCPGTPNDFRNPDDMFGPVFETGHTFVLNFQTGTTGNITLVNPDDLTGSLLKQAVKSGDAITYIEEIILGGNTISRAGWRLWKDAVVINTASGVSYNPDGTLVLSPLATNVNIALNELDIEADRVKTEAADNTAQNIVQDVAITDHEGRIAANKDQLDINTPAITQNASDIASNLLEIESNDVDILALQTEKLDKLAYASSTAYGVITTKYDPNTNTLFIRDDGALTP